MNENEKKLTKEEIAAMVITLRKLQAKRNAGAHEDKNSTRFTDDPYINASRWVESQGLSEGECIVVPKNLYENFCAWSMENNSPISTQTAFGRALQNRLPKKRTNLGVRYLLNKPI